jgi:RTA1 like protein
MVIAVVWQTAMYAIRAASMKMPTNQNLYMIWFIMILSAPIWINAFVYMVVGRMVWNFMPNHKLGGIKAWRFGSLFVVLDVM